MEIDVGIRAVGAVVAFGAAVGALAFVVVCVFVTVVDAACEVLLAVWLLLVGDVVDDVQPAIDNEAIRISTKMANGFFIQIPPFSLSRISSTAAYLRGPLDMAGLFYKLLERTIINTPHLCLHHYQL